MMTPAGESTCPRALGDFGNKERKFDASAPGNSADVKSSLSNLKSTSLLVGSMSDASNGTSTSDKARRAELLAPWMQSRRALAPDMFHNSTIEGAARMYPAGSGDGSDMYNNKDRSSGGFDQRHQRDSQYWTSSFGASPVASMDDGSGMTKVRKPYTITKQRERWTDEEHNLFLEALKEYGRQWVKIAEYIGTKTAVQIRSHAQKFFSRVEKEKQSVAGSSAKSTFDDISIPPPRPKRKPSHPYPRKAPASSMGGAAADQSFEMPAESSVAAVAAAASAAAAAAAAAVVAAAGQHVQARLQASPPAGFPFFGRSPADLEQQAHHAVQNSNKVGYFAMPQLPSHHANSFLAAKRPAKEAAVKNRENRPNKRAKSSGESGELVVRSDGDSACSGEEASLSEQGGYGDDYCKADGGVWELPRRAGMGEEPMPSFKPEPAAAAAAAAAWEQAVQQNKHLQAVAGGPAELHAWLQRARQGIDAANANAEDMPRHMQAYMSGFQSGFPHMLLNSAMNNSLQSPAYDPRGRHERAVAASGLLPEMQTEGYNGSGSGGSVIKNSTMAQKEQHASDSKAKDNSGGYDRWSHRDRADGSPDSGGEVREPASPSVHEAGPKGPSNTTGSGSDTIGSGQNGNGTRMVDTVQLKETSGSKKNESRGRMSTGNGGGRSASNKADKGYNSSGADAYAHHWHGSSGDRTAMINGDNGGGSGSQNGSGGNGDNGSGGSNVGNGVGRSSDEERSSCELDAAPAKPSQDAGDNPYLQYDQRELRYASQMLPVQGGQQQQQQMAAALQHAQSPWLHYSPAVLAQMQHAYSQGSMGHMSAAQQDSAFMHWSMAGYNMQRYLAARNLGMNTYSTATSLGPLSNRAAGSEASLGRNIESASSPPRFTTSWRMSGKEGHKGGMHSGAGESPDARLDGN